MAVERRVSRWWAPAVMAVAAQLYGLYRVAPPPSDPLLPNVDKLEHWVAFAAPVLLISVALGRTRVLRGEPTRRRLPLLVGGVFAVHAVVSELIQGAFYQRRTADPFDVVADVLGIVVGAGVATALLRTRGFRAVPPSGSTA